MKNNIYRDKWLKEKAENKELKSLIRDYKRAILDLLQELENKIKDIMNTKEL